MSGFGSSPPRSCPSAAAPVADIQSLHNAAWMKAYGIFPTFELSDPNDGRVKDCISLVSGIVLDRLQAAGDAFYYVVDWRDPGSLPWQGWTDGIAEPHVVSLSDPDMLAQLVRISVDPFSAGSAVVIRSIATCRAVTFGFDGQAFLCLRHEDEPPVSPDTTLVTIEERPEFLTESDYFDGWLGEPPIRPIGS